jgi:dihydrodipicolinate synthase/N-acetylneuraminate lyase
MARLVKLCRAGSVGVARALHERLLPWRSAAVVESNPIPV